MPQPKKHPSARRRRNAASTAATLRAVQPGEERYVPPLPAQRWDEGGKKIRWLKATRDWWEALWAAPMSSEYDPSDVHQLYILADLYDRYWRNPTVSRAAEIRHQRALFGMTPYDRRRLEWTIEIADEARDRGNRRRAGQQQPQAQPEPSEDPRNVLNMA